MNAATILRETLRRGRVRRALDAGLAALPWIVAGTALAWRFGSAELAVATLGVAAVVTGAFAGHRARTLDTGWLMRELDAQRPDMEDSADLLYVPTNSMTPLERLQRARLEQRLEAAPMPDLRPRWSRAAIGIGAAVAAVSIATVLLVPTRPGPTADRDRPGATAPAAAAAAPRVVQHRLRVVPPAYTGLPMRDTATLDARAPQGAQLQWTLRLAPQPRAAHLVFHDGRRIELERNGDEWRARDVLVESALYRIVLDDALPTSKLHRLDAIPDRPPQLRVLAPERSLSLVEPGQRGWALAFEASDDYGLADTARLKVTLAQGSGENVAFSERVERLRGTGSTALVRKYAWRVDLAPLRLAAGDDLIVQLSVDDNRSPSPQGTTSTSLILRWPSEADVQTAALDGMVKKAMPAFFRSQRQIILDAEALLQQRRKLHATRYVERSDGIGVDQRLLRLRYGQFLGEEAEGGPKPPPTSDVADETAHDGGQAATAGHADHAPAATARFGEEGAVLEEYGHTHDLAEAATLLDPQTRATLKAALDEMWQSELNLRQGHPELALPYAYRALKFIKQVQQASRIYLARVGPELPPIDESRRLGGDRAGLARRDDVLSAASAADPTLANLWRALDETPSASGAVVPDFVAFEVWLRDHSAQLTDPLALAAVLDALRTDPACVKCRRDLRALLWPLLVRPATTVPRRDDGGAMGSRYFDALAEGRAP